MISQGYQTRKRVITTSSHEIPLFMAIMNIKMELLSLLLLNNSDKLNKLPTFYTWNIFYFLWTQHYNRFTSSSSLYHETMKYALAVLNMKTDEYLILLRKCHLLMNKWTSVFLFCIFLYWTRQAVQGRCTR